MTTLVIMAAGIGSRFGGGIKQLEPVDDKGHIIMDYSVHDAIEAGFNHFVFVIRKDIEEDFREVIGNRIEAIPNITIDYAFQDLDDIPEERPEGRTKPWGTGHAIMAARGKVNGPFAVINADDYYGKTSFINMYKWLTEPHSDIEYAMAGYILRNTLSDNGAVTRGICEVTNNKVTNVTETSGLTKDLSDVVLNSYVSMNFWGFPKNFIDVLVKKFNDFFETEVPTNPLKAEFLIPIVVGKMLKNDECSVELLPTTDTWYGMTYKEDVESVRKAFKNIENF